MAVFARGYRAYRGAFHAPPAALAVAGEAYRTAIRSVAFRRIRTIFLIWFVMIAFFLYLQEGSDVAVFLQARWASRMPPEEISLFVLRNALRIFYVGVTVLVALLSVLVGAGLVSDDLGTRALQLYLVRPVRPIDYALGKALVIPMVLVWMALLPGVGFFLLMAFWQDPGETIPFLTRNVHVLGPVFEQYVIAAGSYTGIVLFLSSRSSRRTAVAVVSAAAILGGVMLRGVAFASRADGLFGDVLRHASIPTNCVAPFLRDIFPVVWPRGAKYVPQTPATWIIATVLLLVGLVGTWRRARSVEVTG
jgi:ABC-type transport system involved in multi-copper enzyme maturation permease subunit